MLLPLRRTLLRSVRYSATGSMLKKISSFSPVFASRHTHCKDHD
jgi:hypothetical protein